ncbi:MAG: transcription elongation factor GreA [Chloroflexi bacterium]|nr:transcription elongation factor GreA [Chloroflexota bacterium]
MTDEASRAMAGRCARGRQREAGLHCCCKFTKTPGSIGGSASGRPSGRGADAARQERMISMAKIRLTREGLERLHAELDHLRQVRRQELAERIRQAREESHGDSGDSTAYEDAKTELAILEQRIGELDRTLSEVEVVPERKERHTEVAFGARVVIRDADGEQEEYIIVDHAEADPRAGRLSQTSPVGRAVLGHRTGDQVSVETPAGMRRLTIVDVR